MSPMTQPPKDKLAGADVEKYELTKLRVELRKSYKTYFRWAWNILNPQVPLTESWHYDYIAEWLEYATSGQILLDHPEWRGLIINVPPRTLKSSMANIIFPTWCWATKPEMKFLCVSWGQTFSENEISVPRRRLLESPEYRKTFPKTRISPDMNMKDRYDSTAGGYMVSCGRGGSGMGANIVIIDDILELDEAYSAERENANEYYRSTLTSRRNNAATDFYIVICQRLHEKDLPGYLLDAEKDLWKQVVIPLECERDEDYVYPLSGTVYPRKKGEVLLPDRFPPHEVALRKKDPIRWTGFNQQKPMPDSGNLIDPSWWEYFETDIDGVPLEDHPLPQFDMVLFSVDASQKDTKKSDFNCIQKQAYTRNKQYTLNCVNEKMDEVVLENTIVNLIAEDAKLPMNERATILLIEDKANGSAVIQRLRRMDPPLPITLVAVNPEGGKQSRAMAAQPEAFNHNCYLPKIAPWLQPFKKQLAFGIGGDNDDMIDAWSQGWTYRREHRWGFFEDLEKRKAVVKPPVTELSKPKIVTQKDREDAARKVVINEFSRRLSRRMGRF